jgi:tRNA uridine 5-carbamoylmethylation protein Kti12
MLVGVPGSGKSTYLNNLESTVLKDVPYYVASSDRFIEAWAEQEGLTYQEVFKTRADEAMSLMYDEVMEAIKSNLDVYWDQTNLTIKSRRKKLALFPEHYRKTAVYFPVPTDLQERLNNREKETGKHIPENVVGQMIIYTSEPTHDEGFDELVYLNRG